MHPNPIYRSDDAAAGMAYAAGRAFGVLAVNGAQRPLFAHVPFVLRDGQALLHLLRSNPVARAAQAGCAASLTVSGPDGYISPDWYGLPDQVPTWNYIAVRLDGDLTALPPETLGQTLAEQSAQLEARLAPKPAWHMDKMDSAARDRMMRMILPFSLRITDVDATWKLSQNKPDAAREGAAAQVASGFGAELQALAALMRDPPAP